MLIILEGPDGAGKTTLANRLVEMTGAKLLHKGPPQRDVISEYTLDLQWYRPDQGVDVICDRWHLGEEVYGPLLRGGSGFSRSSFSHVEKTLTARGAVMGVLHPSDQELVRRVAARGDDLIAMHQVRTVSQSYRDVLRGSQLARLKLTSPLDEGFAEDLLVTCARHVERAAARLNPFTTYVGDPHPRWLLLGEVRNQNRGMPPQEAAFTPGPATSGHYLLESLPPAVLHGCGLANAAEENVGELWEVLGRPATVALGRVAQAACQASGIRFGAVPHPQFVRRFHHQAGPEYGALIRETLLSGEDQSAWRPST